MPVDSTDNTD